MILSRRKIRAWGNEQRLETPDCANRKLRDYVPRPVVLFFGLWTGVFLRGRKSPNFDCKRSKVRFAAARKSPPFG